MTRKQQVWLGIGGFCALSVVVYGVGSLAGYHGPQDPNAAASAVSGATLPAPSSKASPRRSGAPLVSATVTVTPSAVHPAAAIDQAGDPGTPCAMIYRADGQTTVVQFQFSTAGEIITHLDSTGGDLLRHDDQVQAGPRTYVDAVALTQVDGAGAILQDPDGTRHVCSIGPQR
ncbi:hypothetical protein ABIA32_002685 [Streptacidiphilus sp. MAP12-20]|uniref:hypothetical protein n=1 Tax=Streptacidiphilus sp. MAP12-20 TaxID=3156299 RepID=UPI003512938E